MNTSKIHEWVNTGLILVVGLLVLVGGNNQPASKDLGASTPGTRFPHGITIGLPQYSPTNLSLIQVGSCVGIVAPATITASTTGVYDCAVTGVLPGDTVDASFSTTTASSPQWGATSSNWEVQGASASSTAGFITIRVVNQTGGNASISASGIASSTGYQVFRTQ